MLEDLQVSLSCSTAQQTIDRLQVELSAAQREQDATRKELEGSKDQLCLVVTKLEDEKKRLETQLSDAQRQQEENKKLMGNVATPQHKQANPMPKELNEKNMFVYQGGKFKTSELETSQSVSLSQSLGHILTSNTRVRLQQEQELVNLKDRLKAQREIRKHQEEVEKLQRLLTSSHSENNRALKVTVEDSSTRSGDLSEANDRLQQRVFDLERAVSTQRGWSRGLQEEQDEEEEMNVSVTVREQRSEESVRIQDQNELTDSKQISDQGEVEWERWTSTIQRWEGTRHLAEGHRTQLRTHPH
ncbi:hypothetical protein INR49_032714 [Caranx melampygus]|nr:hypothetical protein INR49_032714 [Caranx melampygus]